MAKKQVGVMKCPCCGHEIPVKTATGDRAETLSFPCSWCDFPGYAKAGTQAHKIVSKVVRFTEDNKPAPKEAPKAAPNETPPAPARASGPSWFPGGGS